MDVLYVAFIVAAVGVGWIIGRFARPALPKADGAAEIFYEGQQKVCRFEIYSDPEIFDKELETKKYLTFEVIKIPSTQE